MRQLPLDLQFMSSQGRDDFIIGDSNRLATTWIDRWPDWPGQYRVLNLVGPAASGKGHLASIWREQADAAIVGNLADWRPDSDIGHAVLDNPVPGPQWPEEPFFHLVNATSQKACSLLIVSREPVAGLGWQLADLTSRLRSANLVRLERPDDALLRRLLENILPTDSLWSAVRCWITWLAAWNEASRRYRRLRRRWTAIRWRRGGT